jgi:hypothetical protein
MPFSFKNFYHPAPAQVQRICAAMKALGGAVGTAPGFLVLLTGTPLEKPIVKLVALIMLGGWLLAMLGETLEKLSPPAELPDEAALPASEDAEPQQPNTGQS